MTTSQKHEIKNLRMKGLEYTLIAKMLGLSTNTVKSFCRRNNISKPDAPAVSGNDSSAAVTNTAPINNTCKHCGKPLPQTSKTKPKTFCSDKCRFDWWNANRHNITSRHSKTCAYCGTFFNTRGDDNRKYCSHSCYIAGRYGKETRHDERAV